MSHEEFPERLDATALDRRTLLQGTVLGASALVSGLGAATAHAVPAKAAAPADAADRLLSGQAWDDFCEQLRQAGHVIEKFGAELTPLERAEWYRYLSRLARSGLSRFVENDEPLRPRLVDAAVGSWRTSINVTSPDQDHLLCHLDPGQDYVITGNRGTVPYFIVAAWTWAEPADPGRSNWAGQGVAGLKAFNPAVQRTTAFLQSDSLKFDEAGNFTLHLGREKREGNWLPLTPDTRGLLIRIVFHDRRKERPATMQIRRADGAQPAPIGPAEMSAGLARAAQEVLGRAEMTRVWWQEELGKRPNELRFSRQLYLKYGGVADRHFAFSIWKKAPAEALVIEFTPPECEYWIFQLCNIWQENLDNYEDGQGYVTKFTAAYEKDGAVRLVIADENPGIGGNWVDAYRHEGGIMGLRLIKTADVPEVRLYRLPLARLRESGWAALSTATLTVSGGFVP